MANIFSIDADTRRVILGVLDDFLADSEDGGLARKCLVVYPPRQARCENCVYDQSSNRSSNRPRSGAPVPFAVGAACPLCSGRGTREEAATEELVLKCTWEFKKFLSPPQGVDVRLPNSVVEVKGYMTDLPKLLKAQHLVVGLPTAPYLRQAVTLIGEPFDPSSLVPNRYFVSYWQRKK